MYYNISSLYFKYFKRNFAILLTFFTEASLQKLLNCILLKLLGQYNPEMQTIQSNETQKDNTILRCRQYNPMRLRSCRFVHFLWLWRELIVCWSFWIFSGDRRACISGVSRMRPKTSRAWEGPNTSSGANGTPRYWKICFNKTKAVGSLSGGSMRTSMR